MAGMKIEQSQHVNRKLQMIHNKNIINKNNCEENIYFFFLFSNYQSLIYHKGYIRQKNYVYCTVHHIFLISYITVILWGGFIPVNKYREGVTGENRFSLASISKTKTKTKFPFKSNIINFLGYF